MARDLAVAQGCVWMLVAQYLLVQLQTLLPQREGASVLCFLLQIRGLRIVLGGFSPVYPFYFRQRCELYQSGSGPLLIHRLPLIGSLNFSPECDQLILQLNGLLKLILLFEFPDSLLQLGRLAGILAG